MEILLLFMAVAVFSLTLRRVGVVPAVGRGVSELKYVNTLLRSDEIDDEEKELAARQAASVLGAAFLEISWRLLVASGAGALVVAAGIATGLSGRDRLQAAAEDPLLLGIAAVLSIVVFLARR